MISDESDLYTASRLPARGCRPEWPAPGSHPTTIARSAVVNKNVYPLLSLYPLISKNGQHTTGVH